MTDIELLIDLHLPSDRQGPGSIKDTLKALECMNLPSDKMLKVADIGSGSGGQTITLSENLNCQIIAVDLFPEFLEVLDSKMNTFDIKNIQTLQESMDNLPFAHNEFDVIWSEGAIYNIGFENGIKRWKDYLKQGGYLAVSEITWITSERPEELEAFWKDAYPEIDIASNNIKILESNGYSLTGYFNLSEESWIDNYYKPLESRFNSFLEKHHFSDPAKKVVLEHKDEIDLYMRFKDYYSYGFYIARKN